METFKGLSYVNCPHQAFSELHQLDTFYNSLNSNDQDALDSAAGGNFLDKMPQEEYSQEVLGFSDSVAYNNPSPYFDPIVSTSSPTLTPFDESDFLLFEEADAFIAIDDEPVSPVFNATYYDPEDLKVVEPKESSLEPKDEIPEVELKELPPHLEFIKDFSKISRPMTHLLEKNTPFIFSEDCILAFQTLKKKLTEAPILIAPNWDQPFEIMCDASDYAIGAVLGQRIEKHFRPIHYASKTMTEAETNYTTTEKEMLAVVYAFRASFDHI
ncbi:reverse transcriptase domain-containing protein [Tanacetum coccineum]|uniref:Reverse transcriptase domain-containing protein n=1 Tax=Tanacetum coccineum TaxID=301880 RepID=A0ABQ4ZX25_9ASTR